jgi:hypothetical protein
LDVDDAQSTVPQAGFPVDKIPDIVGASMIEG